MFRTIKRSFVEGVRGMVKNGLMTVTSVFVVTACIFIFGIFLMITFNINNVTDTIADEYQVDVYVSKEGVADDAEYKALCESVKQKVKNSENIDASKIKLVKGEDRFKSAKKDMTEEQLKAFEGLPPDFIPDSYTVRIKDISKVDATCDKLAEIEGVESVENSSSFAKAIEDIEKVVKTFSVWIIVIFAIISLFIISNTIKLTVHNRRKEINIMKYVGATDSYIKGPFITEGMLVGIISAVIAFFISQWTYSGLMSSMPDVVKSTGLLEFKDMWHNLLGAFLILGCIIGAFGSSISVKRYLKV